MSSPYHFAHSAMAGINEVDIRSGPTRFASQLAKYIRCPSTIRVRTLEQYGRAPSITDIQRLQVKAQAEREQFRTMCATIKPREGHIPPYRVPGLISTPEPQVPFDAPKLIAPHDFQPMMTTQDYAAAIAKDFEVSPTDILGKSRVRTVMLARRTLIHVIYKRRESPFADSMAAIGMRLNLDHSTVSHALKRFDESASPFMRAVAAKYLGARP